MLMNLKTKILLLIIFTFSFQFLNAAASVISADELETMLGLSVIDEIILDDDITLKSNLSVAPRDVIIRGNGYTLTRGKYTFNATGTSGTYNITFDGITSTGSGYLFNNTTASTWNIRLTGTNNITATNGTAFRESASSSAFTVDTGAVLNVTGTGTTSGLINNFKTNVVKGEANVTTTTSGRGISTSGADASLEIAPGGKLTTISTAGTIYDVVALTNGGTVNVYGEWQALVYGAKVFTGGKTTIFTVDGGNVDFTTGVDNGSTSISGAVYSSGGTSTLNLKNNGIMTLKGKSEYALENTAGSGYDFNINVEKGSILNGTGYSTGINTSSITGANIKLDIGGTSNIQSTTGYAIQGGNKTYITVDGGNLKVNSRDNNAFYSNGYGTDIKVINGGTADFSSDSTSSTVSSRVIYISDATRSNVSNFEVLSGSKLTVRHNGAGHGIYMDDTSATTITVDGSGSELKVEAPNGSYALYTEKYGTDFFVTNGGKAEFISGGTASNTFYLSDASNPSNINVLNGSKFIVTNTGTGASRGMYTNQGTTIINVDNSELIVNTPNITGTGYGIYISNPSTTIQADNKAKIYINTGGSGAAVPLKTNSTTGTTNITVQGGSLVEAKNNSNDGGVFELNSKGTFDVKGKDTIVNAEITNSSNSSSAISGTSSGFTINLNTLGEMYITNRSSSNATLNAGGGVNFNSPAAYDIKNLGGGPAVYNNSSATALSLVNTDIAMWEKMYSPGFATGNILDIWSNLNANLQRAGTTTVSAGNRGTTSVTVSNIGRITMFEKSGQKSTVSGGTSTVTNETSGTYYPGSTIIYEVTYKNDSDFTVAQAVAPKDKMSEITTTLADGTIGPAFKDWTITASNSLGSSGISKGTTLGTYSNNTDLNTLIDIAIGDSVTYKITATVADTAVGEIVNTAIIGTANVEPSVKYESQEQKLAITKIDGLTGTGSGTYFPNGTITYKLKITNSSNAGFADNVSVSDQLSGIMTTLNDFTTGKAFSNWTIKTPVLTGTGTSSTITSDISDTTNDLVDTADIAPGGSIEYTIVASVNAKAIGEIRNTPNINSALVTDATTSHTFAKVDAVKTYKGPAKYIPGEEVTFELVITNSGSGIAGGISVEDIISAERVLEINGVTSVPSYTSWRITSASTGTASGNSNGITTDLNDMLTLNAGSSVIYTIKAIVNPKAAGVITNTAKVAGEEVKAEDVNPVNDKSNVTVRKELERTLPNGYTPGQPVGYIIVIENTGTMPVKGFNIQDIIANQKTKDILNNEINAFTSWIITGEIIRGEAGNVTLISVVEDLNDTIDIGAGARVEYFVDVTLNPAAADTIVNTIKAEGQDIVSPEINPQNGVNNVTATKTYTGQAQGYTPGEQITFDLVLTNNGSIPAIGVTAIDNLSAEVTTDINGNSIPAYTSWTITSSKTGIVSGNSTGITTDLNDTLKMAAGAVVTYTITAIVNPDAAGQVGNTAKINDVDVTDSNGPIDPINDKSKVISSKELLTNLPNGYTPGQTVEYKITLENTGSSPVIGYNVKDIRTDQKTIDLSGITIDSFISWTVTGTTVTGSTAGVTGTTINDLNDTVSISAGGKVEYIIQAVINPNAAGSITNTGKDDGGKDIGPTGSITPENDKTKVTTKKELLTSLPNGYTPGQTVEYKITLENTGTSPVIGYNVKDIRMDQKTTDLSGTTIDSFTSWTVAGAAVTGNATGVTASTTSDLNDILSISAGGKVEYTINAVINTNAAGSITNTGKDDDGNDIGPTGPITPENDKTKVTTSKVLVTSLPNGYTPGQTVEYKITLENTGTSPITDYNVKDIRTEQKTTDLSGATIDSFTSWTVVGATITGSATGVTASTTSDLNDILSISAGGKVEYTINAVINTNAAGSIANAGKDDDGNDIGPTGPIIPENDKTKVTTSKVLTTSLPNGYTPGQTVEYKITLENTGTSPVTGYNVKDIRTEQKTTDLSGTTIDSFTSWTVTGTTVTGSAAGVTGTTTSDLNDTLSISAGGKIEYTINAVINTNAAGSIANAGKDDDGNDIGPTGPIIPENDKTKVTTSKVLTTSLPNGYTPGQTVEYKITLENTGTSPVTGYNVKDIRTEQKTTDLNGMTIDSFTSWTVMGTTVTGSAAGVTGTTINDLNDTVSISAGGKVEYIIQAVINPNAAGSITNAGKDDDGNDIGPTGPITPENDKTKVTTSKVLTTSLPNGYTPGQTVEYKITLENTGTSPVTGYNVKDIRTEQKTTDLNGATIDSFTSWTVTGTTVTGSTAGVTASTTNNLNDTISISAGGKVEYTINAVVNANAAGSVTNAGKDDDGNDIGPTGPITPENDKTKVTTSKVLTTSLPNGYTPGQTVEYKITLENTGTSPVTGYNVKDIRTDQKTTDLSGTTIDSFTSWTVTGTTVTGSATGVTASTTNNLNDILSISAGGKVEYTINAVINTNAAGSITNAGKDDNGNDIGPTGPITPENDKTKVTTSKVLTTSLPNGYTPGQTVEYKITLENTGTSPVTGYNVKDIRIEQKTTDLSGATIDSFTSWTVTGTILTGSAAGVTASTTSNLNDIISISAGGKVEYTINAVININAAGNITNAGKDDDGNNIGPTGPITPENDKTKVTTKKELLTSLPNGYTPGQTVEYKITLENTGTSPVTGYNVKDIRTDQKTTDLSGATIDSFTSWTVTGTTVTGSAAGVTGTTINDLNDTVSISAGGKVEYIIQAIINPNAAGSITNAGKDDDGNDIGPTGPITPENDKTKVTTKKELLTSLPNGYTPGQTVEYKITLENTGSSPVTGYNVKDIRTDQKTTDLSGATIDSFTSWTVAGATVTGNATGVTASTTSDLNDTLSISAGGKVEYTINAVININAAGSITNAGRDDDGNDIGPTGPITPENDKTKVTTSKVLTTSLPNGYIPGQTVEYKITLENTGTSPVTGYNVKDIRTEQKTTDLSGTTIDSFTSWTVTGATVTGSSTGVTGTTISDLNDTISISAGGKVEYTINAVININAAGSITNAGKDDDGNDIGPTGPITPENDKTKVTTSKVLVTSLPNGYTPGQTIEYKITLENTGTSPVTGYNVKDIRTDQKTTDLSGTTIDSFTSWTVTGATVTGSSTGVTGTTISDLNDTISISAGGKVEYTINAVINTNAAGSITNTGKDDDGNDIGPTGPITPENDKTKVTTKKELLTSLPNGYTPGQTVEYKITLENTGTSPVTGYNVKDIRTEQKTTDLNGMTIDSFTSWTVTGTTVTGSAAGVTGTTTSDLNDTISISAGGKVEYTINAVVNANAAGSITNAGKDDDGNDIGPTGPITPENDKTKVTTKKELLTSLPNGYTPGQTVEYKITLENTGTSPVTGYNVKDIRTDQKTTDLSGATIDSFTSWTVTGTTVTGSATGVTANTTSDLNDTLSISTGGKVEYTINAVINVNAAGSITNAGKNDDGNDIGPTGPITPENDKTKVTTSKVLTTSLPNGYTPGQTVEYKIILENTGSSPVTGYNVKDIRTEQKTTDLNGTTIDSFTSWTVTGTTVTGSAAGVTGTTTSDLNDTISISAGGKVEYTINAVINTNAAGSITNVGKDDDGNDIGPTGPITPENDKTKVTTSKVLVTSLPNGYTPGQTVEYKITLENIGTSPVTGYNVKDIRMDQKTTDLSGATIDSFTSWTVTGTTLTGSAAGVTASTTSDLNDTISISTGGKVEYTINAVINTNAAGSIRNAGKDDDGNDIGPTGPIMPENDKTKVTTKKELLTSLPNGYTPGQTVEYKITLENTGTSPVTSYNVKDIRTDQKTTDLSGTTIDSFTSWTVTGATITGSSVGVTGSTTGDLNDTISISAGGKVEYTINAVININAAGNITNAGKDDGGNDIGPTGPIIPENDKTRITTSKVLLTNLPDGYTPGQAVEYKITLENTGTSPVTGYNVKDIRTDQKTTDLSGTTIDSFTSWTVAGATITGSTTGVTASTTSDLNDTISISAGGKVEYIINAVININAAGSITNAGKADDGNNIGPTGSITPENDKTKVTTSKVLVTSLPNGYTPGQTVEYKITLENTGTSPVTGYNVKDIRTDQKTTDLSGTTIDSFTSWTVTGTTITGIATGVTANTTSDLNDTISVSAGGKVEYTINAVINVNAAGSVTNAGKADDGNDIGPTGPITSENDKTKVTTSKVLTTNLPNGYTPGQTVEYKITLENTGSSPVTGYNVKDIRTEQKTTDLNGTTIDSFTSWTVTGTTVTGSAAGVTGTTTSDLNDTISISAGGKVEYTINAVINTNAAGSITNVGKDDDGNDIGPTGPITPENDKTKVTTSKVLLTSLPNGYTPGQTVEYKITLENTGSSPVTGYNVKDIRTDQKTTDLSGATIDSFTSWTVTGTTVTGIATGVTGTATSDLNDTISISAGGKVEYTIHAVINTNTAGSITNAGRDDDGNDIGPTGPITPENDKTKVTTSKVLTTSLPNGYTPGQTVEYKITLENTGSSPVTGYNVKDIRTEQKTTDLSGTTIDSFTSWTVAGATITGIATGVTASTTSDLNDTLSISAGGKVEYTISAVINTNAAGSIANAGKNDDGNDIGPTGPIIPENDKTKVTTSKVLTTSLPNGYTPGQTVEYKITLENTGTSPVTGYNVKDIRTEQKTTDLNGTTIDSFTSWTVTGATIIGSATGVTGTTTSDLNDTLSISAGGKVEYTINAVINTNAAGSIANAGKNDDGNDIGPTGPITPENDKTKVTTSKVLVTSLPNGYTPGQTVEYKITLENTGTSPVTGYNVKDIRTEQKTTDLSGATIDSFTSWTVAGATITGSATGVTATTTSDLNDILSISAGGKVEYTINAVININAAGSITNAGKADDGNNIGPTGSITPENDKTKVTTSKVLVTSLPNGYTPGQTVEYKITLENTGTSPVTGYNVKDIRTDQKTTDLSGTTIDSFTSWTVTGTTITGIATGVTANTTSDLNDTISVSAGGKVEYTINAVINVNAAGSVTNAGKADDGNDIGPTGPITSENDKTKVTTSKVLTTNLPNGYTPGQTVEYKITLENTGSSPVTGYNVKDIRTEQKTTDLNGTTIDSFTSWTVTGTTVTGSAAGVTGTTTSDLNDTISISAGGKVEYTINAVINTNAAGSITNVGKDDDGNDIGPTGPITPENDKTKVTTSKVLTTSLPNGYTPGQTVEYKITLENTGTSPVTGYNVKDIRTEQKTTDLSGTTIDSFTSWTVTGTTVTGSATGITANTTSDLNDTISISAGGKVEYTINAVININAAGSIANAGKDDDGNDIGPTGSIIPENDKTKVRTKKELLTSLPNGYTPGQTVEYKITLENTSTSPVTGYNVKDIRMNQKTTDLSGMTIDSFTSWTVTGTTITGSATGVTASTTSDLNDTLSISAGGKVEYTINAVINTNAAGSITNAGKDDDGNDIGPTESITPKNDKTKVRTKKELLTSLPNGYTPGQTVEYKITLENTGTSPVTGYNVKDIRTDQKTTDLNGTTIDSFTSWIVTGATATGSAAGVTTSTTNNLNDTISISAGGKVEYTINAVINVNAVGSITNAGQDNDGNDIGPTGPITPENDKTKVTTSKVLTTNLPNGYTPGQTVEYKITLENTGTSPVTGYNVKDIRTDQKTTDLSGATIDSFTSWTVTGTTVTGSAAGVTASAISNLNDTISISAGGKVEYTINAVINANAAGSITNAGKDDDGNDIGPTGPIIPENDKTKVTTKKELLTSLPNGYTPGQTVEYKITLENTGTSPVTGYNVKDIRTDQKTTDLSGTTIDSFTSWTVTGATVTGSATGVTGSTIGDLNDTISISAGGKVEYTINAGININAAGSITNAGKDDDGNDIGPTGPITPKNDKTKVTTSKVLTTSLPNGYTPGQTVEYKITLENTGTSPVTGYNVKDIRTDQKTTDLNGATIDSFISWTVTGTIATGSAAGMTVSTTNNLNDTISISAGGKVEYTINAVINTNAAGSIVNAGKDDDGNDIGPTGPITPENDKTKVTTSKVLVTSLPNGYRPGQTVEYKITLENTGTSPVTGYNVKDIRTDQKTTDLSGATIDSFTSWTVTGTTVVGSATGVTSNTTSDLNDTISISAGGKVEYTIRAVINANAAGSITNTGKADDGNDIGPTGSITPENDKTKVSTKKELLTSLPNGYTPGQTVEYKITLENTGSSPVTGYNVKDIRTDQKTTDLSGTTIDSFTSWMVTGTTVTGSATGVTGTTTSDLNDTLSISAGGKVEYTINAVININAAGSLTNVGKDNDNSDIIPPTGPIIPKNDKTKVTTKKELLTSLPNGYTPGQTVEYKITLENTGTSPVTGYNVKDIRTDQKTADLSGTTIDSFTSWIVTGATVTGSATGVTGTTTSDLNDTLSISAGGKVEYTINAVINTNAAGNIINVGKDDNGNDIRPTKSITSENDKTRVTTKKELLTSLPNGYTPGQTVEYKITLENTGTSPVTGYNVKDVRTDQKTTDLSGTTIDSFTSWTVTGATAAGSSTGVTASTTSNLNDTLSISAGGKVEYTINAVININAAGSITNLGKDNDGTDITPPTAPMLPENGKDKVSVKKELLTNLPNGYIPGQTVKYKITLENAGTTLVTDYNIKDIRTDQKTTDLSGATIDSFTSWTVAGTLVTGSATGITASTTNDLNDTLSISAGGKVEYTIDAVINTNAAGSLTNVGKNDDGTNIEPPTGPLLPENDKTKVSTSKELLTNLPNGYIPGQTVEYKITVENTGTSPVTGYNIKDIRTDQKTTDLSGATIDTFTSWTITGTVVTGSATGVTSNTTGDLDDTLSISPSGKIEYLISAIINVDAAGKVTNKAVGDGNITEPTLPIEVENNNSNVTAVKELISELENGYGVGEVIEYKITVENKGNTIAKGNVVKDIRHEQKTSDYDGDTINAFDSWEIIGTVVNGKATGVTTTSASDLDDTIDLGPNAKVEYIIKAKTHDDAYNDIINIGYLNAMELKSEKVQAKPEEANLTISKSVSKDIVEQGELVEYTVRVYNNGRVAITGLNIKNLLPAGFTYIAESVANTKESKRTKSSTTKTENRLAESNVENLVFSTFDLDSKEEIVITYAVKVGTTVQPGKYKASAVARESTQEVTGYADATVQVIRHSIANKATIIGKVYEDVNGDGIQNEATASNIVVKGMVDSENYIPDTAELIILDSNGKELSKEKISNESLSFTGIKVSKLEGKSLNKSLNGPNKIIIRNEIKDANIDDNTFMTITTNEGMDLTYNKGVESIFGSKGDVKSGINSQEFYIKKVIKRSGTKYIQEITIENVGIQEEGIAGAILRTPTGLTITTDEFGRYHIPDEYVEKERGKNFIIKVDEASLPKGMKVISENPRVKLITQYGLNEFNFGVQAKKRGEN